MPLQSLALQVCRMDAMVAFYAEAFGVHFQEVEVSGLKCFFGTWGDVTLKLVPLRDQVDFEAFPIHQLGVTVARPEWVQERCLAHGGRLEGVGAIRDPDGNTIELEEVGA